MVILENMKKKRILKKKVLDGEFNPHHHTFRCSYPRLQDLL